MPDVPAEPRESSRARLIFAGVLGAGLLAAIIVVALSSGGGRDAAPADPDCVSAWNDDPAAVSLGVHQFNGHGYDLVEVTRLDDTGRAAEACDCAVVFAASTLDQELGAAAQTLTGKGWEPLGGKPGITPERLGELQAEAGGAANATLEDDGMLTAD